MTKYNVGVQCFPEKRDRQMAMVYQPGSQHRENALVRYPIRSFLAGRVRCDRHCIADLVAKAMRLPGAK